MGFRKFLLPKSTVQGLSKEYKAWEFHPANVQMLPPMDMVCISCSVFLPRRYVFTYIGYHRSMAEFLEQRSGNTLAYSYLFIAAQDGNDAKKIIADIRLQHPELRGRK